MFWIGLIIGALLGAIAGWIVRPKVESRASELLPFLPAPVVETVLGDRSLAGRLESAIAEIDSQIRSGVDRERNATRLQILREVKDGD